MRTVIPFGKKVYTVTILQQDGTPSRSVDLDYFMASLLVASCDDAGLSIVVEGV